MDTLLGEATIRNRTTGEGLDVVLTFDPAKKDPYGVRITAGDNVFFQRYSSLPSAATIRTEYDRLKGDQKAA